MYNFIYKLFKKIRTTGYKSVTIIIYKSKKFYYVIGVNYNFQILSTFTCSFCRDFIR